MPRADLLWLQEWLQVAESAARARRLHFGAQASALVREKVPADSKMSHVLKH